jgi:hypothetical protein
MLSRVIELTDKELNVILYALQKQPYEIADPVIRSIAAQLQPTTEKVEENNK